MPTLGKKFLRPVSVVVATLLASALQNSANATPSLLASLEKASELSSVKTTQISSPVQQLMVKPATTPSRLRQAQHMSHSSHSSHRSHYSGYSGIAS